MNDLKELARLIYVTRQLQLRCGGLGSGRRPGFVSEQLHSKLGNLGFRVSRVSKGAEKVARYSSPAGAYKISQSGRWSGNDTKGNSYRGRNEQDLTQHATERYGLGIVRDREGLIYENPRNAEPLLGDKTFFIR